MPLSPPAERQHLHTRKVTCAGYRRTDGLWDIEGHLTDEKTYGFDNDWRGRIEPGMFIHEMWIRLTVDNDLTVHAVEVVTDHSPFAICPHIAPNFQRLVGLRIAAGWTQAVKERLGGIQGCTHLVELLGPVATTAFQTVFPALARERAEKAANSPPMPATNGKKPMLLNSCHAFASDGPVVKRQWPDFYTGPKDDHPSGPGPAEEGGTPG